jgi:putative intracellular protease/amidase
MGKHDRALIVVTSHSLLGLSGRTTGFHLADVTHTLFEFERVGIRADIMSLAGGPARMDENSRDLSDPINRDYMERKTFQHKIQNTLSPENVNSADYGAIVLTGGYGALWDFPENRELARLIAEIYEAGGYVGAVGTGACGLISVTLADGSLLVKGRRVTGMIDREIILTGLAERLPVFPQTELTKRGAQFLAGDCWRKNLVVDGRLITGQNTASAQAVGEAVRRNLLKFKPVGDAAAAVAGSGI